MSKHTPGPWHATAHGSLKSNIVYDATGYAICDCTTFHGQHRQGEGDANAHLIAAAPEMFDALRELTIAAEAAGWDIGDNASVLNAARAAIAKAEGGA